MKFFGKKRVWALLLAVVIVLMFYNTKWIGQLLYPIKYREDIETSAAQHRLDPLLIAAIIRVESNFTPDLISPKNAVGLMQIMPETAEWIIEKTGYSPETAQRLHQANVNIEMGSWYVRFLMNQFQPILDNLPPDSQIAVVAAAYNAGPGAVNNWLRSGIWDGTLEQVRQIPYGETRHYIQRVTYYYKKYQEFYADEMEIPARR
jgi:soluble lytic murein transglycosylase